MQDGWRSRLAFAVLLADVAAQEAAKAAHDEVLAAVRHRVEMAERVTGETQPWSARASVDVSTAKLAEEYQQARGEAVWQDRVQAVMIAMRVPNVGLLAAKVENGNETFKGWEEGLITFQELVRWLLVSKDRAVRK